MKKPKACIIDFSTNNLLSIERAIKFIGFDTTIVNEKCDISSYDLVILPGVGAFNNVMKQIRSNRIIDVIEQVLILKKNLLSICLGMQILFEESSELGHSKGIGFFKGKVENFKKSSSQFNTFVGWNNIEFNNKIFNDNALSFEKNLINSSYYFVHSCYVDSKNKDITKAISYNGDTSFASIVAKDNVIATQFHPEKSGKNGIRFLEKILKPIIS
tara:strand:- start:42 stop:686 length:645 start_codon:yes stop_codon:yes gene_type:complete